MLKARWAVDASGPERESGAEFERIFAQHSEFACRVLRRFGVSERDLADACQDVFLVVHRKLSEFEARASVRTWVYRICVRVAADYRKRAHRRYELLGETFPSPADAQDDAPTDRTQLARHLARALDRLEPDQRAAFVLYELEELSMREVAARLRCPLKTAFSRLYAARRQIRRELRRAGYACVPFWLALLPFWKARAAFGLRAATGASSTLLMKSGFATCTVCALALLTVVLPPPAPSVGPMLVAAAQAAPERTRQRARPIAYRFARRQASETSARPVPVHQRVCRARPVAPVPDAPAPASAATPAAPEPPTAWIRAPQPATPAPAAPPARSASDLEEILAATSIKPLLRFGPGGSHPQRAWVLVPDRTSARHSDRSPAGGSSPTHRASTRR